MRTLDLSTLRAFVTVADTGGVTRAAGFLNLTQSAVSMQLKRLEEALGLPLLDRSGRTIALTQNGEQLLGYARQMLALNDEAITRLTSSDWEGTVKLGVPHDILHPVIPDVLRAMKTAHPRVKIELVSLSTQTLRAQFAQGALDVIVTTEMAPAAEARVLVDLPLRWIGAVDGIAAREAPLPLAFCRKCAFRRVAMDALTTEALAFTEIMDSENELAAEATVSADLAVTAQLDTYRVPGLVPVPAAFGLPDLPDQRIALYATSTQPEIVQPLCNLIDAGFRALQMTDPARRQRASVSVPT